MIVITGGFGEVGHAIFLLLGRLAAPSGGAGWPIAAGDAMKSRTPAKMRSGASMIMLWSQFGGHSKRTRCVGNAATRSS